MSEVYFAHSKLIYGTKEESEALSFLKSVFKNVCCPHNDMGELGSITPYLKKVGECKLIVVLPYNNFIGKGVYEEIKHALLLKKPVLILEGNTFFTVKSIKVNDEMDWKFKYGKVVCFKMRGQRKVPYGFWTKERIKEASLKYTYRKEFEKAEPSAYRQAQRLKILDTACGHLKITRVKPY